MGWVRGERRVGNARYMYVGVRGKSSRGRL